MSSILSDTASLQARRLSFPGQARFPRLHALVCDGPQPASSQPASSQPADCRAWRRSRFSTLPGTSPVISPPKLKTSFTIRELTNE